MDWVDYRKKLGIGFSDRQLVNLFLNRMFNALEEFQYAASDQISSSEYFMFCRITGAEMEHGVTNGEGYRLVLRVLLNHRDSLEDFLSYYAAFVNCQTDNECKEFKVEDFKTVICKCLDESHIPFEIISDDDGMFFFPKGAKELDDALISEPLEWLSDYPNARKTFVIALKQYSEGIYIRDVADNLRKSLEAFLQEFLCNTKNLETNKNEICKYLGEQGIDSGVSGLFQPLINSYKNINDRIAKHNDAVDGKLLEFLLYQTGVLIRMVIAIKKTENGSHSTV